MTERFKLNRLERRVRAVEERLAAFVRPVAEGRHLAEVGF